MTQSKTQLTLSLAVLALQCKQAEKSYLLTFVAKIEEADPIPPGRQSGFKWCHVPLFDPAQGPEKQ